MSVRTERIPQFVAGLLAVVIVGLGWRWLSGPAARPDLGEGPPGIRAAERGPVVPRGRAAVPGPARGEGQDLAGSVGVADAERAPSTERAVLCGVVRSADGSLAEARVWLYRGGERIEAGAAREGVFAFPGLAEGDLELRLDAATELPYRTEVTVRAPLTRYDVTLPARQRVTVRAQALDGLPLRQALGSAAGRATDGLTAVAFDDVPSGAWPKDPSRSLGAVVGALEQNRPFMPRDGGTPMSDDTLGILALPADRAHQVAVVLGDLVLASRLAGPGETDMLFVLDPAAVEARLGKVALTVVDVAGQPIVGARVMMGSQRAETDVAGRAEVGGLAPGPTSLHLWARAEALPPFEVDVVGGGTVDLGRLTAVDRIEVPIDRGENLDRLVLRYHRLGGLPPGTRPALDVAVLEGAAGPLRLFPGRYRFLVEGPGGCCIRDVDLTRPPAAPLRFERAAEGVVTLDSHVRVRAQIEILDADGVLVWRQIVDSGSGGRFGLPVGRYTLVVTDSDGAITRRPLELTGSGAVVRVP